MANISGYLSNATLAHTLGKTAYTMPTVYVALFKTNPTSIGTTTSGFGNGTESTYTNYVRVPIAAYFPSTATAEAITNSVTLPFATCGATGDTIVGWGLYDSATTSAGNLLYQGTCSLVVSSGITPQFNSSNLTVTLS